MKSGMNGLKLAVAICVVAATATAMAQGQGRGGGFGGGFGGRGGFGNDPTLLLGMEPVQKELTLSDDQIKQVQKLADDSQQAQRFIPIGAAPEEMQTKMQDLAKANKKKADDILLVPQRERLDQISIQFAIQTQGPAAFTRQDIVDKLGLTSEQKDKIQALADDMQQKIMGIFQDAAGDFQAAQEKVTKLRDEQKAKAMELLTADQKTKLTALIGKEFKIDPMALFGGRGGRRGGQQN